LINPSSSKKISLWAIPESKIVEVNAILKRALQSTTNNDDDNITEKIVITRRKNIDKLKTASESIKNLKEKNGTIIYPTSTDIKDLQALIEVNKKYPDTWKAWLKTYNPMAKIKFLSSPLDWLYKIGGATEVDPSKVQTDPDPTELTNDPQQSFEISFAKLALSIEEKPIPMQILDLTKHIGIFGATGSGKSILLRRIIEEVAINKVPCIVIDIAGDLANLGQRWKKKPPLWDKDDELKENQYFENTEVIVWTPENEDGNPFRLPKFKELLDLKEDNLKNAIDYNIESISAVLQIKLTQENSTALHISMEHLARNKETFNIDNLQKELVDIPNYESAFDLPLSVLKAAESVSDSIKMAKIRDLFPQNGKFNRISDLVYSGSGKTRISVIHLGHIYDSQRRENIVASILDQFYTYIKQYHKNLINAMLFIDEAHNFAPAQKNKSMSSKIITSIANEARKFGFGIAVATQKLNGIDTNVTMACNTKFVGKQDSQATINTAKTMLDIPNPTDISKLNSGIFFLKMPTLLNRAGRTVVKVKTPFCLSYAPDTAPDFDYVLELAKESRKLLEKSQS
ncbi:MAG: ATP-binding protein, partial [Endomicrobium sp.]|nr:ATP-binding protein [Endomicrobium sp.]